MTFPSILIGAEIFGNSKEYASSDIIFYKYSDRITFTKEHVFTLKIDENGDFKEDINITDITYIFSEFEIYHAYFYLEPEGSYEFILPPFVKKEDKDIFNPYFEPERIHIGVKNMKNTDLNFLIIDFDYYYEKYLDLNHFEIYFKGLESDVDTFINSINEHFKDIKSEYFNAYKKYRLAALKNIATQKKREDLATLVYFTFSPILYDNPAYMDLFNNIFDSYFDKYLISKKGPLLYTVINYGHSISRLHKLLSQNIELGTKQFRELVILKGLNDAFGNRNMSWLPLLLTLDSLSISTNYDIHKQIAQNIYDNTLHLATNTAAPIFELPNIEEQTKNLKDYYGKYVYIQFANTNTYSSKMEFELMKRIYERYKGVCVFITILTDDDIEKAKKYIKKNKLEWEFLFTNINSPVISMYKIDTYPTYYLVDPNGFLKMSPALSPAENFESALFNIIESEKEGTGNN